MPSKTRTIAARPFATSRQPRRPVKFVCLQSFPTTASRCTSSGYMCRKLRRMGNHALPACCLGGLCKTTPGGYIHTRKWAHIGVQYSATWRVDSFGCLACGPGGPHPPSSCAQAHLNLLFCACGRPWPLRIIWYLSGPLNGTASQRIAYGIAPSHHSAATPPS